MDPYKILKDCKVLIGEETYSVIKAKKTHPKAFANIVDIKETTVIIDQTLINFDDIIEIEKDWKLLTFDLVMSFELVGFLAIVSAALAKAKVSIFAISSYSTDHILVKQKHLDTTKKVLSELGCLII